MLSVGFFRMVEFKNAYAEALRIMRTGSTVKSNLLDCLTDYFADIVNASPIKLI